MLLHSKKKGPAAWEYQQRGLPRLDPKPAPASTRGRGLHVSKLGHTAGETEVLRTLVGLGALVCLG